MRIIYKNILENNYIVKNVINGGSDEIENIENIFLKDFNKYGRFNNKIFGEIEIINNSSKETINSIAIVDTNVKRIFIVIDNKNYGYDIYLETSKYVNVFNIEETSFNKIKIFFYGFENSKKNLGMAGLIISKAIDFPPHDSTKTHAINFTREQFFSMSGQYFSRKIPLRSYDEWSVSFNYITNDDKKLIKDFFTENDFTPFILQIWKLKELSKCKTPAIYDIAIYDEAEYSDNIIGQKSIYGFLIYGISKYQKEKEKNINGKFSADAGLFIITNNIVEFKKTNNPIYQWKTELKFREVR